MEAIIHIFDNELRKAKDNNTRSDDDFDSYVGMFENLREEKDYDWMSDISIPEFTSQMLTQSSLDVDVYFQTRDFVEVYLQDESDQAVASANACKELINRTLNQKKLYHYQKFVRSKLINHLGGKVYFVARWVQEKRPGVVGQKDVYKPTGFDINGVEITNEDQIPNYEVEQEDIMGEITVEDRFDYDVIDQRNVFTDNSYTYSLQQKEWVYIRTEKSLEDLKADEQKMGYKNLDELGKPPAETETSKDSYNKRDPKNVIDEVNPKYDIYDRYGTFWTLDGEIGINDEGKPKDGATLEEVIMTFAVSGSKRTLIRFMESPFIDPHGKPYKPIGRGLCYIHPTNDGGIGDGAINGELQTAINDTFNISNDRVRLATIPVLKATKNSVEDNTTLYIEPGHVIEEYEKDDVRELTVSTDITGATLQMQMLMTKMQQAQGINPPSMGQLPSHASTTATAVAGAEQHTNIRNSYKGLTYEYTALTELYDLIMNMTYQFAGEETAYKLMGEKMYNFDPTRDYYYKPVSQSLEPESSKAVKRKEILQMFQIAAQTGQAEKANYLYGKYMEYLGDEFVNYKNQMNETPTQGNEAAIEGSPASNQQGLPQSPQEQLARG